MIRSQARSCVHPPNGPLLDHRVGQQAVRDPGEGGVVDRVVDLQLETLALADFGDPGETQAGQGIGYRLSLRVEDLGLGHDVDDDTGHGRTPRTEKGRAVLPDTT